MPAIFLGDFFSLDEPTYLGRPIANKTLLRSIFECDQIEHVLAVGNPQTYHSLGIDKAVSRKLINIVSVANLVEALRQNDVAAIFCSSFGKKYAQLIHFRNINGLNCSVFGITHTLSYQDEVGAIYRMMCAGVREHDGILCTSPTAIEVMKRLIGRIQATLSFRCSGPSLELFPLGYEAEDTATHIHKRNDSFQVLYVGRLDWQTKADLLVIPRVIDALPQGHNIRFVIAGASANPAYVQMLQQACAGLPVLIEQDISDKRKNELYRESHAFFSPSDNYQETFGISVLEAKHHGCVPVISDFDGYRYLVENGKDGILLKTWGASVPEILWRTQILMPDPIYHGWWATGVSMDPAQTANALLRLAGDRVAWRTMSMHAMNSAKQYSVGQTAARFGRLISRERNQTSKPGGDESRPENPFQFDYSDIFMDHPSAFWKDEKFAVTPRGLRFLGNPSAVAVPQLSLLGGAVSPNQVAEFLRLANDGFSADKCISAGTESIILSIALKNGLVSVR